MEQNMFMGVEEVRSILKISRSAAYKIIRNLNLELEKKGYMSEWFFITVRTKPVLQIQCLMDCRHVVVVCMDHH